MFYVFFFLLGLAVGSFLNVVIFRLKYGGSIILGRSACPQCKNTIAWYDNLPLLSFIVLAGRCRHCRKKISWQYPLVELATGLIFILIFWRFGWSVKTLAGIVFAGFLLVIFIYDFKYYLILDRITIPAMIMAFLFNLYLGFGIGNLALGVLVGGGFFLVQFLISRSYWVGDGDIRLGALMGIMLGWKMLLVALFLAYVTGAAIGVILIILGKKKMSSKVPFGTFLSVATLITILWGEEILEWYLKLMALD